MNLNLRVTPVPLITNSGACRHRGGGDSGQLKQAHLTKGAAATAIAFCHASYFSIETKLSQSLFCNTTPPHKETNVYELKNLYRAPGSRQRKLTTQVPHRPTHLRSEGGERDPGVCLPERRGFLGLPPPEDCIS